MLEAIEHLTPYLFTLAFVVIVIEIILSASWSPAYFRTGIPVYRQRITDLSGSGQMPSAEKVETFLSTAGGSAPLLVRRIGENRLAFREKLFHFGVCYSPVMRGLVTCKPATGEMEVRGYLNWYILLFIISILLFLSILPFEPANIIIPICMFVLLTYIYWIQKKRFREVEDAVRKLSAQ
jgi:hypothetical protein